MQRRAYNDWDVSVYLMWWSCGEAASSELMNSWLPILILFNFD
jgi:hypothetical protein